MGKMKKTTSTYLIAEIQSLLEEAMLNDKKELKGGYISLKRVIPSNYNQELLIITISDDDGIEIDIQSSGFATAVENCIIEISDAYRKKLEDELGYVLQNYGSWIIEIKFQNVRFSESPEKTRKNLICIEFSRPCKLIFDNCSSSTKLIINSMFMSQHDDSILVEKYEGFKKQDSAGVKFINCNFDRDVEVHYKTVNEKYGKFWSEGCTFRNLKIGLDTINDNRQDFFMEFRKNKLIERLEINHLKGHKNKRGIVKLTKDNNIQIIRFSGIYPDVSAWGLNEKIGEILGTDYERKIRGSKTEGSGDREAGDEVLKTKINQNKQELMVFRKQAVDKGDRLQQAIISRHISKCDEQLISLERWSDFWQENLTMWAGRLLSNHGGSWLKPLLWAIGLNMCFSLLVYATFFGFSFIEMWVFASVLLEVFVDLFNPLTTTAGLLEKIPDGELSDSHIQWKYPVIGLILIISKAFYAACVYEFVRAARQFTYR